MRRIPSVSALALGAMIALAIPAPAAAAERGPREPPPITHGAFVAPTLKMTSLVGEVAPLGGAEAGWIIAERLVLGGAGYGSLVRAPAPAALQPAGGGARLRLDYAGARVGLVFGSRHPRHFAFGMLVGGGRASTANDDAASPRTDGVVIVEPDATVEVNVTRHLRLGLGASYRLVLATDAPGLSPARLGGPTISLSIRLGLF